MLNDFKALKLSLASPQQILNWSHGEVKKAETINYRTHRSEVDGLMDEKIFGPTKNYECYCGKYKKIRYKGIICDKCGVEVTHKRVRRERLGHIKLATPVTHIWYSYGVPNKLALILGIQQKKIETVIYFSRYLVTDANPEAKEEALEQIESLRENAVEDIEGNRSEQITELEDKLKEEQKTLKKKAKSDDKLAMQLERLESSSKKEVAKLKSIFDQRLNAANQKYDDMVKLVKSIEEGLTLSEEDYNELAYLGVEFFDAQMGAEAVYKLLQKVDIEANIKQLKEDLASTKSKIKIKKSIQKLRLMEGMLKNDIKPEWMVLFFLPVLPPDLRPIIQLPGGRFATSDLNDLYRRVVNRNNRLKRLIELGAPEIILRNEKRMLQESVDALIDNSHRPGNPVLNSRQQPYKSLSDMLRGKQGRFRQNLLGKRVDFSGRSVIVSGPELTVNQCGLPKTMALELFKPFVMHEIIAQGLAANIKSAKNIFDEKSDEVWDILERVIDNRPVMLNRAPTLHKQGIQAFYPVLVEGNAIRLHPLVCKGFNADFDGDQMAVHVPLSELAVSEVKERMFPENNILLMADGKPVINTDKDMAYGVYYLTGLDVEPAEALHAFADEERAIGAYSAGNVKLREKIKVLIEGEIMETTVGRILFNRALPEEYSFMNEQLNKKGVAKISARILEKFGGKDAISFLNEAERIGFKYATESGFSIGMEDFVISERKDEILEEISQKEKEIENYFEAGLITKDERRQIFEKTWLKVVDEVAGITWGEYTETNNNLFKLNDSGASPVENPLKQISGIRGLIVDPSGKIVELPLRSNYKQGLTSLEYFVAARGTRKALADVALKTAESGYLTRKLVDVAQDVITREEDCETERGVYLNRSDERRMDYADRLTGRFIGQDIELSSGEKLSTNDLITAEIAEKIEADEKVESLRVRSPLTCEADDGICIKCYGYNLGTKQLVKKGIAVGVISAQAIGEASTQLTLDAKHRSGSATAKDITQGLPRVEELLEARSPKAKALLSELEGKVSVKLDEVISKQIVTIVSTRDDEEKFDVSEAKDVLIAKSKKVKQGDVLFVDESGENVIAPFSGKATLKKDELVLKTIKGEEKVYELELWENLIVEDGDKIMKGDAVTSGSIDPKELMGLVDIDAAQKYIIDNIQTTFGIQGIGVDDKHVEIIVRQMSRFMMVRNPGTSSYLPGDYVDLVGVETHNDSITNDYKAKIKAKRQLMGISNASLRTESFLSAASFQDQVRVLTDVSIIGKVDELRGLKENVIIGRPVPLGSEVDREL